MKNCYHCKDCNHMRLSGEYCYKNELRIPHPHLMGGPKKCKCFEPEFKYPTKGGLS